MSGIRIMKACVREAYEKTRFGKANGELVRTQLKTLVIFAFMNPLTNAIMYIAVMVILLAGSFSVGNGRATPGNVMAALTYTTQLLNGVLMLVMLFQNISRGLTSWKRVKEVLESVPELLKLMIRWTVIVGLVCTFLFEVVPGVFIRMFGSADDPVYYDFAVLCLRIYLSLILVTCVQKVCAIFLQSIGKAKAAAPLSVLRDVLLIVFSLLIPVFMGVTGIFWAAPAADVLAILVTAAVMLRVCKELGHEKKRQEPAAAAIRPSRQGAVITIAREHGSAGKRIGQMVAEKLDIPCYYKELVAVAAQESGLAQEFISGINSDENAVMRELYLTADPVKRAVAAQEKAIRHIADAGSCVIIGRSADYVLRGYPDVVRIFIYAPESYREKKVMEMYGDSAEAAKKSIARSDAARGAYYKSVSGQEWGNPHGYELCIDSSVGEEETADMICSYIRRMGRQ